MPKLPLRRHPGLQSGDHPLASCGAALAVQEGAAGAGEEASPSIASLAAQLAGCRVNLNVGAETCPIAEEAVVGSHLVLSEWASRGICRRSILLLKLRAQFPGCWKLLEGYNSGQLCR